MVRPAGRTISSPVCTQACPSQRHDKLLTDNRDVYYTAGVQRVRSAIFFAVQFSSSVNVWRRFGLLSKFFDLLLSVHSALLLQQSYILLQVVLYCSNLFDTGFNAERPDTE